MSKDEIFRVICRHACEVIPSLESHNFRFDDALKDLGANSTDRSEILMMTLETLALRIPLVATAKAKNIGELADVLSEKYAG